MLTVENGAKLRAGLEVLMLAISTTEPSIPILLRSSRKKPASLLEDRKLLQVLSLLLRISSPAAQSSPAPTPQSETERSSEELG